MQWVPDVITTAHLNSYLVLTECFLYVSHYIQHFTDHIFKPQISPIILCIIALYVILCYLIISLCSYMMESQVLISILQPNSKYMAELGIETHF